jgi:uncharacterized protein YggE
MKRKLWQIATLVAVLLAAGWLLAGPARSVAGAQDAEGTAVPTRMVSTSGTGQVSVTPDIVVISLGVQTEAADAGTAASENATQMDGVITALEDAGVAAKDIRTQVVRLVPREQQPSSGTTQEGPPEIAGFTATQIVDVTIHDISSAAEIIDNAVQAGANVIQGIQFDVSSPGTRIDQARQAAWDDAMHKAQQLAELSGSTLGMVLTINETSRTPRPITETVLGAGGAAAIPIQAGTQTIEVDLQVTWLLTGGTALSMATPTATPTTAATATPATSGGGS